MCAHTWVGEHLTCSSGVNVDERLGHEGFRINYVFFISENLMIDILIKEVLIICAIVLYNFNNPQFIKYIFH